MTPLDFSQFSDRKVSHGVPQGSALGPQEFIVQYCEPSIAMQLATSYIDLKSWER